MPTDSPDFICTFEIAEAVAIANEAEKLNSGDPTVGTLANLVRRLALLVNAIANIERR